MKSPANPYVGPVSLTDKQKIYGRDREIADLMNLLISERIVLLYSPSGAGKTSLLQAGLIPTMKDRGFTVRDIIRVNGDPPEGLEDNRYSVSAMASLKLEGKPTEFGGLTLAQYLDANPNGELLVFDQFEEVITADPFNYKAKERFFDEIGESLRARGRWAVFAMREDYLARLDPYLRRVPTRLSNTFRLYLLSIDASIDAIRNPAIHGPVPVQFSLEAAKKLAGNLAEVDVDAAPEALAGRFVEPVQLQVVCKDLWEKLPEGTTEIVPAHISAVASIDEALGKYYADSVEKTAKERGREERSIRDWFGASLIRQGIRAQVLKGDGLPIEAVDLLEKAHLVRSDSRLGSTWVELAHDRLIKPVGDSNEAWRKLNLSPFQQEAEKWDHNKRSPDRLLRGETLQQAKDWLASAKKLNSAEEDFLKASQEAEQRQQKDLQTARKLKLLFAAVTLLLLAVGLLWADKLVTEQDRLQKRIKQLEAEHPELTEEAQRLRNENRDLQWKILQWQQQSDRLGTEITSLTNEGKSLRAETVSLDSSIATTQRRVADIEKGFPDLRENRDELRRTQDRLTAQVRGLRTENGELRARAIAVGLLPIPMERLSDPGDQIRALGAGAGPGEPFVVASKVPDTSDRLKALEIRARQLELENLRLRESLEELRMENGRLRAQEQEEAQRSGELARGRDRLRSENDVLRTEVRKRTDRLAVVRDNLARVEAQQKELRDEISRLDLTTGSIAAEIEMLKSENAALTIAIAQRRER